MREIETNTPKITGSEIRPIYPQLWMDSRKVFVEKNSIFNKQRIHTNTIIKAHTYLRVNNEGRWYLIMFVRNHDLPNQYDDDACISNLAIKDALILIGDRIHRDVYAFMVCGKINLNTKDSFGNDVFILDTDQRDESERLSNYEI